MPRVKNDKKSGRSGLKASRPKSERCQVVLSLTQKDWERLQHDREESGLSHAEFVRRAVRLYSFLLEKRETHTIRLEPTNGDGDSVLVPLELLAG